MKIAALLAFWVCFVKTAPADVKKMCSGCHSLDVALSAVHTREDWQRIVDDMVARGATGTPAEKRAAVEYLSLHYGPASRGSEPAAAATRSIARTVNLKVRSNIAAEEQWSSYGHDPGGRRYSPLKQITPGNVSTLVRAWTFHMGSKSSESTPLIVNSTMYVTSADAIFALEPETGKLLWKYPSSGVARRGLAYWEGTKSVRPRLYCGVEAGKMIALDAATGRPAQDFGDNGLIDLKQGVMNGHADAKFFLASPPAMYQGIVITGGNNGELAPSGGAYGDVRGWDARSGKLLWTFHTVPRAGEPGNETWAKDSWRDRAGTNVWGMMTVDTERGLVFLPLGCPTSDMYGGDRAGDGLYGNSLVALDAATGRVKWFRQLVHHDLWDYDLAAPPALIEIVKDGRKIPAVAQITKMSTLFIFDRTNGDAVFGMEERPVPASSVPGEVSSPTQPFPLKPPPLSKVSFSQEDFYDLTREHAKFCRELYAGNEMFTEGPFTPMPAMANALTFPSTLGGGNWGGVSFNPTLGYVFTNVMNLGQWGHMEQRTDAKTGETTYVRTAAAGGAYGRFWNPDTHIPCQKPPFGELVAVNVNTGEIAWRTPLGIEEHLAAEGFTNTGTLNMGGSIATASGLVFIAATNDRRIRAFDARTGKELWTGTLDASGYAVPVTYMGRDGRQYVAVTAGGGGSWASPTGDSVIAFAQR